MNDEKGYYDKRLSIITLLDSTTASRYACSASYSTLWGDKIVECLP